MSKLKKIAVFSSIRSEFEALTPLLRSITLNPDLELMLIAGGAHFSEEMGRTIDLVLESGYKPSALFDYMHQDGMTVSPAMQIAGLARYSAVFFESHSPDILLLAGDRFELLGIAPAALVNGIPIGHISGGDVTEGSFDNQVRNAMTKLSSLHFTGTAQATASLVKMGEESWRICTCGELMLDKLRETTIAGRDDFFAQTGLHPTKPFILVTFHPETINNEISGEFILNLFEAILNQGRFQICATASNPDPGGTEINEAFHSLAARYDNLKFIPTLGSRLYYSAINYATVIVGNSSGPLIEAQSFNKPVVNVGKRQRGRLTNPNVLDVEPDSGKILKAMELALTPEFRESFSGKPNIFGDGSASEKIVSFLTSVGREELLLKKELNGNQNI
ncbi:MAG: UDP-N-acetylglucosamine 2-epimerase (hydrolyzing) [Bacteroidales bacterium]|nr:UDP-N-acetylglucosamine 2-epimerase (hydrolyzing) [Bacteroidales bacterium]